MMVMLMDKPKLIHAQTIIESDKINLLKKLSKKTSINDALTEAIDDYIRNHGTASVQVSVPEQFARGGDCIVR